MNLIDDIEMAMKTKLIVTLKFKGSKQPVHCCPIVLGESNSVFSLLVIFIEGDSKSGAQTNDWRRYKLDDISEVLPSFVSFDLTGINMNDARGKFDKVVCSVIL